MPSDTPLAARSRARIPRLLPATLTLLVATEFAISAAAAWIDVRREGWLFPTEGEERSLWLALDLWRAEFRPLLAAVATAALLLLLGASELLRTGSARSVVARLGHPLALALALLLQGLAPALAALARPRPANGAPNVVLVLVDTWRADHAGFLGYERDVTPELDGLVREGVVFENAIAQAGWTKPSVASLLTGQMPSAHGAVSQNVRGEFLRGTTIRPGSRTLFEALREAGWETAAWATNPNVREKHGFASAVTHFVDHSVTKSSEHGSSPRRSANLFPSVLEWIDEGRAEGGPFLAYVHVMDPHYPYDAPAPFAGRFAEEREGFQLSSKVIQELFLGEREAADVPAEDLANLVDRYDEEILYFDHQMAAFLRGLRERAPNTLVVMVGDHGEEFREHGQIGHGQSLYRELVHVPLVLWTPALEPQRVVHQVRLIDVYPTLLELAGLGAGAGIQGESLVAMIEGRESGDRLAPMESGGDTRPPWQWRAISDGTWKLVRREEDLPGRPPTIQLSERDATGERPYSLLFDTSSDPGETEDLAERETARVEALFALFRTGGWYFPPETVLGLEAVASEVSASEAAALRDLGYGE